MPEPKIKPIEQGSTKRLEGFSKAIDKTYGGFRPERVKERISDIGEDVEGGVDAIAGELKRTFSDTQKQAKQSVKKIRGALGV